MNDAASVVSSINKLIDRSTGRGMQFIVDSTHPSPIGLEFEWAYTLTDVTGFTATSSRLTTDSGAFPAEYVTGVELPSGLMNIEVLSGSLIAFLK